MRLIASWFYNRLSLPPHGAGMAGHMTRERQMAWLLGRERLAVWCSAGIGAVGVLMLYVPFHLAPEWFPTHTLRSMGHELEVSWVFLLYSAVLVGVELVLTMLNIWCAHGVAAAIGFIDLHTKGSVERKGLLVDIGTERRNKQVLSYGIDPLHGVHRLVLVGWTLLLLLKASLTNLLFRFLVQRIVARHLVRAVQDLAGIPVFAFWNAYGTVVVLRETRVILFGQHVVDQAVTHIQRGCIQHVSDASLLADTLQFIAMCKRDFHHNHYLLTQRLFELFGIRERDGAWSEQAYLARIRGLHGPERELHVLLITLGIVLDGRIRCRGSSS
jgi:hypothetical protein